jgi:hypothetical protein
VAGRLSLQSFTLAEKKSAAVKQADGAKKHEMHKQIGV